MDTKIKKCCPNCSQPYVLKSVTQPKQYNLPLYLTCGHTMCQSCITNILKFEEPIECKICQRDMQLPAADLASIKQKKTNLYQTFPVNLSILGELTFQLIEQSSDVHEKHDNEFFVDLQAIINSTESRHGECMECHTKTSKMCQECTTILCDHCFNKTHKNFVIFKNHVLKSIEPVSVSNKCKVHKGKPLDYYCEDCHKSICMDCLMVGGDKSCKNHNVKSMQEVNENFLENIIDVTPKVDETFRRLTKTAVDVGHLLHNIENETGSSSELTQMLANVKQHFSKITAAVQKHEQEVLDIIVKLKCSEKESLRKAKTDLAESIKKAKIVLNAINATSDKNKANQINLSVLLDEAKQIVETPWFLCKAESNDPLKVAVNEDLCSLVSDYIHLEGNANSVYTLRATKDVGEGVELPPPPPAPVFPPELPKDVRQMAHSDKGSVRSQPQGFCKYVPKYRSKSGSVSSLNSLHSDISEKSAGDVYQQYQRPIVQQVQPFIESQHPKQLHEGLEAILIPDPVNKITPSGGGDEYEELHMRKLFIGGLDPRTDDASLKKFYEQWGEVVDVAVMMDPQTKRSRGFGFITYSRAHMVDDAQRNRPHKIDGRVVDPKPANPRPDASATVKKLPIEGHNQNFEEGVKVNIKEGAQELIYISHIVDPHNFFVQRSCHQPMVKEMLREFRNAVSLPKPSLKYVAEGKVYLMFNKADNMWQRCRVISINRKNPDQPTFLVFCIDFGSTEIVNIDKLRLLPPARVQSPFPLAINCSLANCEPRTGCWTTDDAYLIQNIIDNKQAIIYVRHIRSTADCSMKLECDVFTFEQGTSLAHALVFHERARMPNSKLVYPKISGVMDRPRIYMGYNDLMNPKSVEEVYITHIVSPDKFYVMKKHLRSVYERLCEDLEQEYTGTKKEPVYLPEIGMSYVVNVEKAPPGTVTGVEEGVSWARAQCVELPGRGRVGLQLVDTGARVLLPWTALRYASHRFTTQRALATECHLAGVTPLNKKWSAGSVSLLEHFSGRLLELHVEDARRGSAGVTLIDRSDPDNPLFINNEMCNHKFAVTFGLFMFNKNDAVEDQVFTNKSPLDAAKVHSKPAGQTQILQKTPTKKINEEELDAKDKGPLRLEAKVLHYQSPSQLYVSLVHQQKAFSELYEEIQKHYSKNKTQGKEDWKVGDRCCVLCAGSHTWRRAAILESYTHTAKVFYSDFACIETVPLASLRELAPEFTVMGDAAIKCHLSGIVPADGSEEWPTITKEFLKELLDAYSRVFITKLGNFKNKSMPVEVWVYHTIQGGALEPNKSEWRCLNTKVIEQGLGIPDKMQQHTSIEPETSNDVMLSFLKNVEGSVDEWLQLEPLPQKPMCKASSAASPCGSPETDEDKPSEVTDSSNTVFISDWLPPEPLQCKEFTGMPTYIDNEGVIYLHDVTQQDTLDLIRKALDVRFKAADPKAKYARWTVGEPCIALFFLDNRFYRGRVVEVNEDTRSCFIHYVDYGNEETCSFENLRKSIALYQIPIQAHRCALARVRPAGGAARWDRATLDYIHKSVVEKRCLVRVVGEARGDVTPVDLKFDKLWINDHLVDFEMAEYVDGSKAVVRKFAGDERAKNKKPAPSTAPPRPVDHDSSGPDYIVDEDGGASPASGLSLDGKDWNQLVEDELENSIEGKFITYPDNNLSKFACNVSVINDIKILELSLVLAPDTAALYERVYEAVQNDGYNMWPINGIFEHKACIALFPEDGQWYRASILEYSETQGKVKVRYVDYGNIEIISLADVREMTDDWAELPAATVRARLHGVTPNPQVDKHALAQAYADTFLEKGPFHGKVIKYEDGIPLVELRDDKGRLVYEELIEKNVLIRSD